MSVSGSYKVSREELDTFKSQWPCHGLPDDLETVTFDFDRGDLVDIEARDERGAWVDTSLCDGPALVALSQDAQTKLAML
jgi:hypothetical protein